jgi:protein-S-isoprenylcysteine O-methyltransferase Ste14
MAGMIITYFMLAGLIALFATQLCGVLRHHWPQLPRWFPLLLVGVLLALFMMVPVDATAYPNPFRPAGR